MWNPPDNVDVLENRARPFVDAQWYDSLNIGREYAAMDLHPITKPTEVKCSASHVVFLDPDSLVKLAMKAGKTRQVFI